MLRAVPRLFPLLIPRLSVPNPASFFVVIAIVFGFIGILIPLFPVSFFKLFPLVGSMLVLIALVPVSVVIVIPPFLLVLIVIAILPLVVVLLGRCLGPRAPMVLVKPICLVLFVGPAVPAVLVVLATAMRPFLVSVTLLLKGHIYIFIVVAMTKYDYKVCLLFWISTPKKHLARCL